MRNTLTEQREARNKLNSYYFMRRMKRDWRACTDCRYLHCMPDCKGYWHREQGRKRGNQN